MATSKKEHRKTNLVQLLNTLNGGARMSNPVTEEKLITFSEDNHKVITDHVKMMLAQEGVFVMS